MARPHQTPRSFARSGAVGLATLVLALCLGHDVVRAAENRSAPDLAALLHATRSPQLAEVGRPVTGEVIRIGALEATLQEGVVYPLRIADGEIAGVLFSGRGGYEYGSLDPVDRQVIDFNLGEVGSLRLGENDSVRDYFTTAVFLVAGPWLDALTAAPADPDGPEVEAPSLGAEVRKEFERIVDQAADQIASRLAYGALNDLDGFTYACAELRGGREDVTFEYDRVEDFEQRLYVLEKKQGRWRRRPVSRQILFDPADRPPRGLRLRHLESAIATEDNRSGTIDSRLTLEVGRDGMRYGLFYLINHRDPRGSWVLDGNNPLEVQSITDGEGRELPFVHERHELLVDLGSSRSAGDELTLNVDTRGEVFTGTGGERHDRYFALHGLSWYPTPVGPRPAGFTFDLQVKVAKPYVPVASGRQVELRDEGDLVVLRSRRDEPSLHLAVFAGVYKTYEETFDGLTIRVHPYAMADRARIQNIARLSNAFVRYFEEILGPYPFAELDIVEIPEYGFGVAPSGIVLLTTEAYKPLASLTPYFSRGINSRLAHEIAHHWFGHRAMVVDPRHTWLAESFAEYAAALAMGAVNPTGSRRVVGFREMLVDWQKMHGECDELASLLAAPQLVGDEAYLKYVALLYNRGPLLLHMLRSAVGEEQFVATLRRFLDDAGTTPVVTDDFRAAVKAVRGRDMGWFFEDWVEQPGIADVSWTYHVEGHGRAGAEVSGTLEQDPAKFKHLVVPLLFVEPAGRDEVRVVFQDEPVERFRFRLAAEPRTVKIDPHENNPADYHRR